MIRAKRKLKLLLSGRAKLARPESRVHPHALMPYIIPTQSPLASIHHRALDARWVALCVTSRENGRMFLRPGLHWHTVHMFTRWVPPRYSLLRSPIYQVQVSGHDSQRPIFPFPTEDEFNHSITGVVMIASLDRGGKVTAARVSHRSPRGVLALRESSGGRSA
jgi:hypothetical protein